MLAQRLRRGRGARAIARAALLLLASALSAWAQTPIRVGTEFQVNTYTTYGQYDPAVAADADGNFVVVWTSEYQDGWDAGIFGQRFDSAAKSLGGEFQVNTYTTRDQYYLAVAADPNGNFLVVWGDERLPSPPSGLDVFGQRFASDGSPQEDNFQVNTYTTGSQGYDFPAATADANGNFVVVWADSSQDGSREGIFGQRLDGSGDPLDGEFQVNTYTTGSQEAPAVAADPSGSFVVVWQSRHQDGSSYGVFGQRFDGAGNRLDGEFQVNTHTTGSQEGPAVAAGPSGNFVVVWEGRDQDGDAAGLFGQRFDGAGNRLDGEFQVTTGYGYQGDPAVAADGSGRFIVVWEGYRNVSGQHFDAAGNPLGGEFQVNTYTTDYAGDPSVAAAASGDFVVVWQRASDVFGQRFSVSAPPPAVVDVDIKPGSDSNAVNLLGRGVIPVAILGSDIFDALDVDAITLAFGPNGAAPVHKKGGHPEDVNDDGFMDLLSHYRTEESGIAFGHTQACVSAETLGGIPIEGCDSILVVGSCGIGFELALLLPGLMWLYREA